MSGIWVLAEHREGVLREITLEMLAKGRQLARDQKVPLVCLVLGSPISEMARALQTHADQVWILEGPGLEYYNSECYQEVLMELWRKGPPLLAMMGHTTQGMDLAPALAVALNTPLVTDCLEVALSGGSLQCQRQIYNGKLQSLVIASDPPFWVTCRPGSWAVSPDAGSRGEIRPLGLSLPEEPDYKRFIRYLRQENEEVDITQANILVSVGRGIQDVENISLARELAELLGGEVSCSRPVADLKWLPQGRQVGSSGKTVRPKIYLALGISGAFQHQIGMKGSETIIAVNKDPRAPIFQMADYGVIGDLFQVVPAMIEQLKQNPIK
jgi:electron transfer flavoprotein alpha subunit